MSQTPSQSTHWDSYEARVYLRSSRAAIGQPLTQAATVGGLAFGWVWILSTMVGDPRPIQSAWLGFFSLALPSYIWRLMVWADLLHRAHAAPAPTNNEPIELKAVAVEEGTTRFYRFPVPPSLLRHFYITVVENGQAPTERNLVRAGRFTQSNLAELRDYLIKNGFAQWNTGTPQHGWDLNARGRSAIRQVSNASPTGQQRQK